MRFGLPVSFLLHAGLLAWAFNTFQQTKPFKLPEPEPVEVAIITEDGLTRLTKGDRSAKKLEAAPAPPAPESKVVKEAKKPKPPEPAAPPPPPPEPEPAKSEPPPPPPPKAEAPPPPPRRDEIAEKLAMLPPEPKGPTPEELAKQEAERKAAEAKAEAERKADEERRQAEAKKQADEKRKKEIADKRRKELAEKRRREREKKKRDEAKRLAELKKQQKKDDFESSMQRALLDKDPTRRPPPTGGSHAAKTAERGPVAGAEEGRDTRLTASQIGILGAMMKQKVAQCWNINSGADGIDRIRIEVEIKLRPDGRLAAQPRVVSRGAGPLYADMANSALRALVQCEPYDLPKQLYKGGWDFMIVEFDPSRMY